MNFRGKVFKFESYKFSDGTSHDKLLVFLNNGALEKYFIVLLTTSQPRYFNKIGIKTEGCHSKNNVFFYKGKPFDKPTYIKFDPESVKLFNYANIIQSSIDGFLKSDPIGEIPEYTLKQIINCFKNSDDYVEGIYNTLLI